MRPSRRARPPSHPPTGTPGESRAASQQPRVAWDSKIPIAKGDGPPYGPENPMGTPPGARTIATVTPSITLVGDIISSAPSFNALSYDAWQSATWMYGMLPGISGGLNGRMPPPPCSEYANRWMSPAGPLNGGLNVQPSTFAAHAFVAAGLLLARSV